MSKGMSVQTHEAVRNFMARPDYNEEVLEALNKTTDTCGVCRGVIKGLGVFLLNPGTRKLLADNDPKAVVQALKAIGIQVE
jgi:hypothetical protein